MKLLKLLTIPAVLLLSVVLAVPVFANHAEIDVQLNCQASDQVCFNLTASTADFDNNGTRDFTLTLLGHEKGSPADTFVKIGDSQTLTLDNNLDNKQIQVCFKDVDTTKFDSFELKIEVVGENLTVNDKTKVTFGPFENNCPTPKPPMSPSPPAPSPQTPTPSAQTVATLASTGGFDFRLPLIGLAVIVAGLALFLVSASRGRQSAGR